MMGGKGGGRNQTPHVRRAERRELLQLQQQRRQQRQRLAEMEEAQVEQRRARAAAVAHDQLRRGQALQAARSPTASACAPRSEAPHHESHTTVAASAEQQSSAAHDPDDGSKSTDTATSSVAAFPALASSTERPPSSAPIPPSPRPPSGAAGATAAAAAAAVPPSAVLDESFEEPPRWRCLGLAPAATESAAHRELDAGQAEVDQGSNCATSVDIDKTSSLSSGCNLSCDTAEMSHISALARYTQQPPPVAIPPNSISLSYLHSFLSADECAELIQLSEGKFSRSAVGPNRIFSEARPSPNRTSDSAFLSCGNPAVAVVRRRVADLTGAYDYQIEMIGVVRYEPGQQFLPHYDSSSNRRHPRRWTIFAYLNDMADGAGGETEFTRIGVKFKPKKGDVLFWENQPDRSSRHLDGEHAGRPPLSGIKYGLNIWIGFDDFDDSA